MVWRQLALAALFGVYRMGPARYIVTMAPHFICTRQGPGTRGDEVTTSELTLPHVSCLLSTSQHSVVGKNVVTKIHCTNSIDILGKQTF